MTARSAYWRRFDIVSTFRRAYYASAENANVSIITGVAGWSHGRTIRLLERGLANFSSGKHLGDSKLQTFEEEESEAVFGMPA